MTKRITKTLLILTVLVFTLPIAKIYAAVLVEDDFNGSYDVDWHFTNYEEYNGVLSVNPGVECGTDACAELVTEGSDQFMRLSINTSADGGIYTNTDVSEVELGLPTSIHSGQWTAEYNRPVTMEARVRWNEAYNFNGSGDAVGTNGVILWNSAIGADGPSMEYNQIGFSWITQDAFFGLLSGLRATTIFNSLPIGFAQPLQPVNINDWVNLKLVWYENILGIQYVKYYVNNNLISVQILPVNYHNLSVEMWNDNQEPQITLQGLLNSGGGVPYEINYPTPTVDQAFEIDYVRVFQP